MLETEGDQNGKPINQLGRHIQWKGAGKVTVEEKEHHFQAQLANVTKQLADATK